MSGQEFFSPLAFDFLWESGRFGEPPYPLQVPSHGPTEHDRRVLRQRAHTELSARGIHDTGGRLDPRIEDWLNLLSLSGTGTVSIDAVHIPDFQAPPVSVLAASDGTNAVVAIQDRDGIRLRQALPDALVSTVIGLLPPAPRGGEAPITLPLDDALHTPPIRPAVPARRGHAGEPAEGKERRRREKAEPPRRTPLSDRAATDPREAYARLSGQPRLRGGQLAANSRNSVGTRQRSRVLAWFDTPTGRYLSLSSAGSDGREWVTIAPADAKTLRRRLGELLAGASDAVA